MIYAGFEASSLLFMCINVFFFHFDIYFTL